MDGLTTNEIERRRSGSFSRASSGGSVRNRHSFNLVVPASLLVDDDFESASVAEAGDIGDRVVYSNRHSGSGRSRCSLDQSLESGIVFPVTEGDPVASIADTREPGDAIIPSEDIKEENVKLSTLCLDYISYLIHLAVFGVLGVLTRYGLQKLFGPGRLGVANRISILYPDLPSNMVGSFLMGWLGIVFKEDISKFSDEAAVGLTTGYLGSVTTFSSWNQDVLDLVVGGHWVTALFVILIGFFLVHDSIILGIRTAEGFKWLMRNKIKNSNLQCFESNWKVNKRKADLIVMLTMLLILGSLWALSGTLEKQEFHTGSSRAQLWLGCIVGPLGVWIRWFLARLNGRGFGKTGQLKWFPFGTFIANVSAACIMAALATVKKAVKTQTCNTIATGVQLGLLGCLSTVSTFVAEFYKMSQSNHSWRADVYATTTILVSFALGTLIYSVPVWTKNYD